MLGHCDFLAIDHKQVALLVSADSIFIVDSERSKIVEFVACDSEHIIVVSLLAQVYLFLCFLLLPRKIHLLTYFISYLHSKCFILQP